MISRLNNHLHIRNYMEHADGNDLDFDLTLEKKCENLLASRFDWRSSSSIGVHLSPYPTNSGPGPFLWQVTSQYLSAEFLSFQKSGDKQGCPPNPTVGPLWEIPII